MRRCGLHVSSGLDHQRGTNRSRRTPMGVALVSSGPKRRKPGKWVFRSDTLITEKQCIDCLITHPIASFHKRSGQGGYRSYCAACMITRATANNKEYRQKGPTKSRMKSLGPTPSRKDLRQMMLKAYGSICVCCGEETEAFLTIDHVNGGGNTHRKQGDVYRDLWRRGWPKEGFRLLCMNCNWARGQLGYCPHERGTK